MMAKPTRFNTIGSGALGSRPEPLSAEEMNKLVNARSLHGADSVELVNERPHPQEKESETEVLPLTK